MNVLRNTTLAFALAAGLTAGATAGLSATDAAAQSSPAPSGAVFGGFKHDSSQPIDIVSDTLEVRQNQQTAIFRGSVVAAQGEMRLTADKLEVLYDSNNSGDDDAGAIKTVKARGNVFISNGKETAQGAVADYDVKAGKMKLKGGVVLTQNGNVIQGETLDIDLISGRGKIGGGRVKSRFTPKKKQ